MWCHEALEYWTVAEIEWAQDEQRRQLLGLAKDNPEFIDRIEEMEPLVEVLEGDPDVVETARRFVNQTGD